MLVIDGSEGEGGGQMVRSSLTLAMLTNTPIRIENIRAGRAKPGLKRQHVTAVRAAAEICSAEVEGVELQSSALTFRPQQTRGGDYQFSVGSAGSATLVMQTILPPLLLTRDPSRVQLEGGTHNAWAPCYDFIHASYLPLVRRLGVDVQLGLDRHGFHPAGGGHLHLDVQPVSKLRPFSLRERGRLIRAECEARVANLPLHIAEREVAKIRQLAQWPEKQCRVKQVESDGPGNVVMVFLQYERVAEVGRQGVPAERIARDVWKEAKAFIDSHAAVGPHLADQWMLPLAVAAHHGGAAEFTTTPLTHHSLTHLDLLQRFLAVQVEMETRDDKTVRLAFAPRTS